MDNLETPTVDPQGITLPVEPVLQQHAGPTSPGPTPPGPTPPEPIPPPRGQKVLMFLLIAGAGLVIAAGIVLMSGYWGGFSMWLRIALAGAGAVVLAIAAAVVATRPPGAQALRNPDLHSPHQGRRILTATLLAGTALMTVFTILQFPLEPEANINPLTGEVLGPPYWTATGAVAAGLIIALIATWVAPGALSTVVTWALSLAVIMTALQVLLWSSDFDQMSFRTTQWQTILLSALGLVFAIGFSHYLRPAILAVALGVATWFFSGFSAAMEGNQFNDAPLEVAETTRALAQQTGYVGKASLAVLLVVGVVMYLRRSEWPWPTGAVAALVGLTLAFTATTLGVAAGLLVAGAVLVVVSGALLVDVRRRARRGDAAGQARPQPGS